MQDNEGNCKHCGRRIREYRGAWFSAGDDARCTSPTAAGSHEPSEPAWVRQAQAAGWRPPEGK